MSSNLKAGESVNYILCIIINRCYNILRAFITKMFSFNLDKPDHVIKTDDTVVKVELSPFGWSANFALIAFPKNVLVANIDFEEENGVHKLIYNVVNSYLVTDLPTGLAISSECVLTPIIKVIQIACATSDFKIHLIDDREKNKHLKRNIYMGHTMHVNDIAFDNMTPANILASVSDDLTCRIWSLKEHKCILLRHLSSPGTAVKLGSDTEVLKLVVAEKKGRINIYNLPMGTLIWCLQTFAAPLMDMDCLSQDPYCIAAICNDYLLMWDLRKKSGVPTYKEPLFYPGNNVRFSNIHDSTVAVITKPLSTLSISKLKFGNFKASIKLPYASNVTWHSRLPYICVGCNDNLIFWKTPLYEVNRKNEDVI